MSRWFRHYAGMMRDEKLLRVAVHAKQPVERVLWVWGAILESAAEINDAGRYELDAAEAAYFLRSDEADIVSIQTGLEGIGRVCEGHVVKWGDRQFQSDRSAARQKDYRDRQKARGDGGCVQSGEPSDGQVTAALRNADAPETETDTDTEADTKKDSGGGGTRASLISQGAHDLSVGLAQICGFPSVDDWPPGWCGSPMWVQKCFNEGWLPDVMMAETRAIAKKRGGPIEHFKFLEKPLARAHAQHQAPLPKVEIPKQETINGANPTAQNRGGSALEAIREVRRRLGSEPDRNDHLSLSKG
jgi:hypothetical protein